MDFRELLAWLQRLIYLDSRVFEDIRGNPAATIPGLFVVTIAMLLSGIGGWLWWMLQDFSQSATGYTYSISNSDILVHSALVGSALAVVLWGLVWMGIVYFMLTQIFRQRAYVEQLLRVMGLASAPLTLTGLMFLPGILPTSLGIDGLSFGIGLGALALTFGLTGIAISSVTTADPAQVLVANATGFLVWAAVLSLLAGSGSEPNAPGIFLYNTTTEALRSFFNLPGL